MKDQIIAAFLRGVVALTGYQFIMRQLEPANHGTISGEGET